MTLRWMHERCASDLATHEAMLRKMFRLPLPMQTVDLPATRSSYEKQDFFFRVLGGSMEEAVIFRGVPEMTKVEVARRRLRGLRPL